MSRAEALVNEGASERVAESPARVVVFIVAAAFLVRILFNVYIIGMQEAGLELFPDGKDYDALGLSLATNTGFAIHGVLNTSRPPGYPFFLAALYMIFGHSYAAVKIVQSLLGALTCLMIFLIGQRLFSRRVGVIAATLATVYPFLVLYAGFLLSETLFVFLSTVFLYVLVRLRERYASQWIALGGLVLGAMNLIRPVTLMIPVLLFFWAWVEFGTKRKAVVIASLLAIWMIVPILPWTVRNYLVTHSYIFIDDHHWVSVYTGNNRTILQNPDAIGGWLEPEQIEGFKPTFKTEDYRSATLFFLRQYLLHEPWELLRLEAYKLKRFWSVFPTSSKTTYRDAMISVFSYGLLLPLFVIGMILSLRSHQRPWILIIWIVNFCFVTLIALGTTRYRAPVEPAIVLFASLALEKGWARLAGEGISVNTRPTCQG
ncbi:MAG TPA: glycosyltransferase family 39 protein [Nitrospiraceae bacterium]|nr:glycosyltransferase family 39 protein [Nitrospiraceae bacterium]